MFVSGLKLCQFVVWTKQGIFSVEVPYDVTSMSNVCPKLERFWIGQVLPFLIIEALLGVNSDKRHGLEPAT